MLAPSPVSTSVVDGSARITIDNPPVDAISQAAREGLPVATRANEDASVRAAILTCAGRIVLEESAAHLNRNMESIGIPNQIS